MNPEATTATNPLTAETVTCATHVIEEIEENWGNFTARIKGQKNRLAYWQAVAALGDERREVLVFADQENPGDAQDIGRLIIDLLNEELPTPAWNLVEVINFFEEEMKHESERLEHLLASRCGLVSDYMGLANYSLYH